MGSYSNQAGGLAGWWYRVGAAIIDGIIVGIVGGVISAAAGTSTGFGTDGIIALLEAPYLIILLGTQGRTVGNRALGTMVVDAGTGQIPSYGKVAIRWVVQVVLQITIIGGLLDVLWPLWDSQNQTIHDKAAGTLVLRG